MQQHCGHLQAYDTSPQQHHSPLSAPASSPLMMHNSPQGAMHNPMVTCLHVTILHYLDTFMRDR